MDVPVAARTSAAAGEWRFPVVGRALAAAALIVSAVGCGDPASPAPAADTSPTIPIDTIPIDTIPAPQTTVAATATAVAVRVTLAPIETASTAAALDPVDYVNRLPYLHFDLAPAMEAYRVVADARGWSPAVIERWAPFVLDVMAKESGGCWNLLGGAVMVFPQPGCEIARQGRGEDAGVGQVTSAGWGRGGAVCELAGLCSREAVIASPWSSVTAMLVLMEAHGRYAWCDYDGAPALHDCSLVGRDERPVP